MTRSEGYHRLYTTMAELQQGLGELILLANAQTGKVTWFHIQPHELPGDPYAVVGTVGFRVKGTR